MPQTTRCEVIEQKAGPMPDTALPQPRKHCTSHKSVIRLMTESQVLQREQGALQRAQGAQLDRIEGRLDLWMERSGHAQPGIAITAGNTQHDTRASSQPDANKPTSWVMIIALALTIIAGVTGAAHEVSKYWPAVAPIAQTGGANVRP